MKTIVAVIILISAVIGASAWFIYNKGEQEAVAARKVAEWTQRRVDACHKEVSAVAKYKSKARFSETVVGPEDRKSNRVEVSGTVDFMNGFGAMIPHKYTCIEYADGIGLVTPPTILEEGGN
jgi:hypothetical protein